MNLKISNLSFALVLTFCLSALPSRAQLLIQVDESDPSNVTFTATGGMPAFSNSSYSADDGFDLAGFFTSGLTFSQNFTVQSSNLAPGAASSPGVNDFTYDSANVDDLSSPGGPAVDINVWTAGLNNNSAESFDSTQAAFTGTLTLDLSGVLASLPGPGTSGQIYPGWSGNYGGGEGEGAISQVISLFSVADEEGGPVSIGQWEVLGATATPEPSSYLMGLIAVGFLGICIYRRSRQTDLSA